MNIDDEIKNLTIETKKISHLKLADSIIAATALALNVPFVTSDKQFKTVEGLKLLLYEK